MQYAKLYQIGKEQLQKAGITDAELDVLEFFLEEKDDEVNE